MADGAALVLEATDRLLGDLADAAPALRAVGDALARLAAGLGVEKLIVAVDDERLGRQVFCSGRRPLGDDGIGLCGPPGVWTQPRQTLDRDAARLLLRAVGVGVVRSAAPRPVAPAPGSALVPTGGLDAAVAEATARAVRHRWGFTLVLARGEAGLATGLAQHLRAADTLVALSDHEVALLLPETAGDTVPFVLARLASASGVAPFSYGLACCPADSRDAAVLCAKAADRLDAARRAAVAS